MVFPGALRILSLFLLIEVQMIHNFSLVSTLQEDSVYCIYITFSCLLHCGLLQNVERSSLCYPGGPSVYLHVVVCIC